jgi:hypothetical protein
MKTVPVEKSNQRVAFNLGHPDDTEAVLLTDNAEAWLFSATG